jgi:hypothetical protein
MVMVRFSLVLIFSCLQVACATYQTKVDEARRLLENQSPAAAVAHLKPLAEEESKDQLVYVLDYATALQAAGEFKQSSVLFQKADKLAELQDYTSVSKEVGSLLFAEEMVQYKGEDFEKLLIHSLAAINYVLMGDLESAQVETRRSVEKLNYFRLEQKKEYQENSFVHYLNGHIWEANRNFDSALIDFEKAYNMGIRGEMIEQDLLRVSQKAQRSDKFADYKKKFARTPDNRWRDPRMGELVVIFQQGWGPRKRPNPESPRFPILVPEFSRTRSARVSVSGAGSQTTQLVYDLESASIKNLQAQYGKLVAKRLAGVVAKETVARKVGKDNELLGAALWVAMHASDRADLRQWSTLPQTIQMAHFVLPAGEYNLEFEGLGSSGESTGEKSEKIKVKVRAKSKAFVGWRSFK